MKGENYLSAASLTFQKHLTEQIDIIYSINYSNQDYTGVSWKRCIIYIKRPTLD